MNFGIPKEVRDLETRVGLAPAGVLSLVKADHRVYVERNAGVGAGFSDEDYRKAGADIVYSPAEAYGRADVVVKVTRPTADEHALFRPEQVNFSFLHLAVASPDLCEALTEHEITAVAYEMIQDNDGQLPVLLPTSVVAGRYAPVVAGRLLTNHAGGRGVLLGGVPGVPPAAVVIIGGGVLGKNAARAFIGMGAQVTILDSDPRKLQELDDLFGSSITTILSNKYNLNRVIGFADVLVGSIQIPGERVPTLITREMVRRMRPGSVIIDMAIDHGGCVETSRPTTLRNPTYVEEGVIHYCVPNLTSNVGRTASYALNNAILPYLKTIGQVGFEAALARQPALVRGVNMYRGQIANAKLAEVLDLDLAVDLATLNVISGAAQ